MDALTRFSLVLAIWHMAPQMKPGCNHAVWYRFTASALHYFPDFSCDVNLSPGLFAGNHKQIDSRYQAIDYSTGETSSAF